MKPPLDEGERCEEFYEGPGEPYGMQCADCQGTLAITGFVEQKALEKIRNPDYDDREK
jgi:hypothetical protein